MAFDQTKTYTISFNTSTAMRAIDKLDDTLEDLEKGTKKFGKAADKSMVKLSKGADRAAKRLKTLSNVGGGMKKVGDNITKFITLPMLAAGAAAVKFTTDFNKGLANVASLIPGQTARVAELRDGIMRLSVESGKSLDDLTGGMYETISAFGDGEDSMQRLEIASKASVAGLATTKEALSLLSAVTKGYGDTSAEAMEKTSDLAFMTVKLGQTTFPELAASMGKVVPLAAQLNTSQEELFGTFATLTGVTGNAAEVSTQISSVYSAMLKPSEKLQGVVKKLGFESASAMMKEKGLRESLIMLNGAVDGNESAMAKMLGRKEALVGAMALLGGQSDVYEEKLSQMNDTMGATNTAFNEQAEGINKAGFQMEQAKRRMINLAIRLGDKLIPVISRLMDKLEPLIKMIEEMDEVTIDQILSIGKWVAILGVSLSAVGKLTGAIGPLISLMGGMNRNAQMLNQSMGQMPGKAKAASRAMRGLQGAMGVIGAGAAGWAIGTMLNETVFDPMAARTDKTDAESSDALRAAKDMQRRHAKTDINTMSSQQIQAQIAEKEAMRQRLASSEQKNVESGWDLQTGAGNVMSLFTGDKSPSQLREERGSSLGAARKQAAGDIMQSYKALSAARNREVANAALSGGGGGGGGGTVNQTNNINISTKSDAQETVRVVKREISKNDRKLARDTARAAAGAGAGEY